LLVRDGTGNRAVRRVPEGTPAGMFEAGTGLCPRIVIDSDWHSAADKRAPGHPGGYEIGIKELTVIQVAEEYPIRPRNMRRFPDGQSHLWVRSNAPMGILRIRHHYQHNPQLA